MQNTIINLSIIIIRNKDYLYNFSHIDYMYILGLRLIIIIYEFGLEIIFNIINRYYFVILIFALVFERKDISGIYYRRRMQKYL
jgi:hypothetical protein